jgi:hypothetical protein
MNREDSFHSTIAIQFRTGGQPMAKKRLTPKKLQTDYEAYVALQSLSDYDPANPAYALAQVTALHTAMQAAQQAEINAQNAAAAARDAAATAEHAFHQGILGVKAQVIAQYGADSDQVQSLGLKKKSEYETPGPGGGGSGSANP